MNSFVQTSPRTAHHAPTYSGFYVETRGIGDTTEHALLLFGIAIRYIHDGDTLPMLDRWDFECSFSRVSRDLNISLIAKNPLHVSISDVSMQRLATSWHACKENWRTRRLVDKKGSKYHVEAAEKGSTILRRKSIVDADALRHRISESSSDASICFDLDLNRRITITLNRGPQSLVAVNLLGASASFKSYRDGRHVTNVKLSSLVVDDLFTDVPEFSTLATSIDSDARLKSYESVSKMPETDSNDLIDVEFTSNRYSGEKKVFAKFDRLHCAFSHISCLSRSEAPSVVKRLL